MPFDLTREDLTDLIAEAISDSIDMDWNSTTGARYVVEALVKEGVVAFAEPEDAASLETLAPLLDRLGA